MYINFKKNRATYALGLLLQHATLAPIITSGIAYKYRQHTGIIYITGGFINLFLLTFALAVGVTFLYKQAKLHLGAAISLPIVFFLSSIILGAVGHLCGFYNKEEFNKEHEKDIFNTGRPNGMWESITNDQTQLTKKGEDEKRKMNNECIILHATLVNFFPVLFIGLLIDKTIDVCSYLGDVILQKICTHKIA